MSKILRVGVLTLGAWIALAVAAPAEATRYTFRYSVSCEASRHMEVWQIGFIPANREALKVSVGVGNPNCTVRNVSAEEVERFRAQGGRVETFRNGRAVWHGILPIFGRR